ncbi:MAG: DUF4160 domain-containing protein [Acidobacteriaceae bacterium]
MPTVLRVDGYQIMIYVDDHLPAHVHVLARGCELVVNLNCSAAFVSVRNNDGFKNPEIARIMRLVQSHRDHLCTAWRELHGNLR